MIEAIVAASLVVVGLLGLFNLIYNSTVRDKDVIHKLQATYLAAEGIEVVKNFIDQNVASGTQWNANLYTGDYQDVSFDNLGQVGTGDSAVYFATTTGLFTGYSSVFTAFSGGSRELALFSRVVSLNVGTNQISVTSTVSWSEEGKSESVSLDDIFYNWRKPS